MVAEPSTEAEPSTGAGPCIAVPLFTEEAEPTSAIAAAAVGGDNTAGTRCAYGHEPRRCRATIAEIRSGHAEGSANILLGYMRRHGAGVKQIKKLGS